MSGVVNTVQHRSSVPGRYLRDRMDTVKDESEHVLKMRPTFQHNICYFHLSSSVILLQNHISENVISTSQFLQFLGDLFGMVKTWPELKGYVTARGWKGHDLNHPQLRGQNFPPE